MSEGVAAQLDLSFARDPNGRTYLDRRLFRWPFTISRTFHLDEVPAGMLTVLLQSVSGAIQAGDAILQRIHVEPGAQAHVTTQGATSVYRAPAGLNATEDVRLTVGAAGWLEYLPEPKILFPDASLSQTMRAELAEDAALVISDCFAVHRLGEADRSFRHLTSEVRIGRPDGRVVVFDRLDIDGLPDRRGRRPRHQAYGTLMVAAPCAAPVLRPLCAAITERLTDTEGLYGAASPLPDDAGFSVRVAARDGRLLRQGLAIGWTAARQHLCGRNPTLRPK